MSKQSAAKIWHGYREEPHNCGNCEHRTFALKFPAWIQGRVNRGAEYSDIHKVEANHRCGIGGFAVKKTATCQRWSRGRG